MHHPCSSLLVGWLAGTGYGTGHIARLSFQISECVCILFQSIFGCEILTTSIFQPLSKCDNNLGYHQLSYWSFHLSWEPEDSLSTRKCKGIIFGFLHPETWFQKSAFSGAAFTGGRLAKTMQKMCIYTKEHLHVDGLGNGVYWTLFTCVQNMSMKKKVRVINLIHLNHNTCRLMGSFQPCLFRSTTFKC